MLAVTCACVLTNHPIVGSVLGGATIVAVVAMFLRQQATIENGDSKIVVGDSAAE
jgi:hypothetical protein